MAGPSGGAYAHAIGETLNPGGPGDSSVHICVCMHILCAMRNEEATAKAAILKAIAHPARVILLEALKDADLCVNDLCGLLDVDQSVVSRHLAHLKRAGIVSERREGVKSIHSLACPCILQALDCTLGVLKSELRRKNAAMGRGRGA